MGLCQEVYLTSTVNGTLSFISLCGGDMVMSSEASPFEDIGQLHSGVIHAGSLSTLLYSKLSVILGDMTVG
jgi:hypothetical protein